VPKVTLVFYFLQPRVKAAGTNCNHSKNIFNRIMHLFKSTVSIMHSCRIAVGAFLLIIAPAHATTITLAADRWCPYNCDPTSEKPGILIEIAQRAFAKHNITVEYSIVPWTRAIKEARNGKFNGVVGASNNDAPGFIFPRTPQIVVVNAFYVKNDSTWQYSDIDSLKNISIGIVADYKYSQRIDAYLKNNANDTRRVQAARGTHPLQSNIKKLLLGRIDTVLESRDVMKNYLSEHDLHHQITFAGALPPTPNEEVFIAFSPALPDSKHYATILADEMKQLKKSGDLKKIFERYGIQQ
jgi:polar amino acid transport system substrate-binding protein